MRHYLHISVLHLGLSLRQLHRPKESVDWYSELAVDHATGASLVPVPATIEEQDDYAGDVPAIRVSEHTAEGVPISCRMCKSMAL